MSTQENLINAIIFAVLIFPARTAALSFTYDRFGRSSFSYFTTLGDALISDGFLQITPDLTRKLSFPKNFSFVHKSGRVMLTQPLKLWREEPGSSKIVASFYSMFIVDIYRPSNSTAGEGLAFLIAPNFSIPSESHGKWLGLTNATLDGNPSNKFIVIKLQHFEGDSHHIGININSVNSSKNVDITLVNPIVHVWVEYKCSSKSLEVYVDKHEKPNHPVLSMRINIEDYVNPDSYFGFSASTGQVPQLNNVLEWNLTVEILEKDEDRKVKIVVGVAVGVVTGVALLLVGALGLGCYIQKRRIADDPNILGALKNLPGTPREFKLRDLKEATHNFDDKMKLGQGGFGVVYKGELSKENIEVAVKKFSRENMKGKHDFLAELTIINRLRHKHLVHLIGWCHQKGMLFLVYDYMPNGSLDRHLFGRLEKTLSWEHRYKTISGIASALHYLHNEFDQKVVHRDLKASNIMLDSDFEARLGDFGLARALDDGKTSYAELEGVPGTMGYIAPECLLTGKATRASDVYAFGAVVLEVVCGKRPWTKIAGFHFLADWVWTLNRKGRLLEAVDERLGTDYVVEEAKQLLLLGLACSHPLVGERPKIQAIVQVISGSAPTPYVPPFKPAFVWPSMDPCNDTGMITYTADYMEETDYLEQTGYMGHTEQ